MYRSEPTFTVYCRKVIASLQARRLLLFIFGVFVASITPRAAASEAAILSSRRELPFALSDFDGDRRPDLAIIQSGRSDLFVTDYWVQLQLSAHDAQAIRVIGPSGGLQIAARDVNGDDVPDLVLSTAWRNEPVAILLNDGHGNFSRIDPSAYPEAFAGGRTGWTAVASPEQDLLAAPPQSRSSAHVAAIRLPVLDSSVRATCRSDRGFLLSRDLAAHPGRAPPASISLL